MTDHSTFRDQSQSRGDGMGLLTVVGLILTGTFWTVGSFLESSPVVEAASLSAMPVSSPIAIECDGCDDQTLTPTPAWLGDRTVPEPLLRATSPRAASPRAISAVRRTGGTGSYGARVGAPVPHDVNG